MEGPISGIKLWVDMNASDKKIEPFAAFMEKHDIPVLIHAWYKTVERSYSECSPKDIACLAGKFPNLRIIMAHLRGCRFRGIQDIKKHPNVWIDTSGSESEDGYMGYAMQELGPERIMFGSDYAGRDLATSLARVESVEMTEYERDRVFWKNAEELLSKGGKSCVK